jgi:putative transcriptional regulator
MEFADLSGQLLLATPRLTDPNFVRSVILLLQHDEDGAIGVILNRPSGLAVADVLPPWGEAVAEPRVLHAGGPVSRESALGIGLAVGGALPDGFRPVPSGFGLVDLDAEPEAVMPALVGVRIFAGYAGWGGGQLEDEIAESAWYVVPSDTSDLLNPRPSELWRVILRRQPGDLAYVANFPDDPTMN